MKAIYNYFKEIFKGIQTLVAGMRITWGYFFSPREIVTEKYPENRKTLKMTDRYKGVLIMPHDGNNQHQCTGCGVCQLNCPNGSIEVVTRKEMSAEGKETRLLDRYTYLLGRCTFCGLCVKSCPSNAIAFGHDFEQAVYDKAKLIQILNKPGSSLKKK